MCESHVFVARVETKFKLCDPLSFFFQFLRFLCSNEEGNIIYRSLVLISSIQVSSTWRREVSGTARETVSGSMLLVPLFSLPVRRCDRLDGIEVMAGFFDFTVKNLKTPRI